MRAVDRAISLALLAWSVYILIWACSCAVSLPDMAGDQAVLPLGEPGWSSMLLLGYFEFYGAVLWLLVPAGFGYALSRVFHNLFDTGRPPCDRAVYKLPERAMLAVSGLGLLDMAYICMSGLCLSGSAVSEGGAGAIIGVLLIPVVLGASVIMMGLCAAMCACSIPIARYLGRWCTYFAAAWQNSIKGGAA